MFSDSTPEPPARVVAASSLERWSKFPAGAGHIFGLAFSLVLLGITGFLFAVLLPQVSKLTMADSSNPDDPTSNSNSTTSPPNDSIITASNSTASTGTDNSNNMSVSPSSLGVIVFVIFLAIELALFWNRLRACYIYFRRRQLLRNASSAPSDQPLYQPSGIFRLAERALFLSPTIIIPPPPPASSRARSRRVRTPEDLSPEDEAVLRAQEGGCAPQYDSSEMRESVLLLRNDPAPRFSLKNWRRSNGEVPEEVPSRAGTIKHAAAVPLPPSRTGSIASVASFATSRSKSKEHSTGSHDSMSSPRIPSFVPTLSRVEGSDGTREATGRSFTVARTSSKRSSWGSMRGERD